MRYRLHDRWIGVILVGVLGLVGMGGCGQKVVNTANPIEIDRREYARMFDAAVLVLRDEGFRVSRQDYRFGRITAHPQLSPTAVEFWHEDNTTAHQMAQSTVNHERRLVSVFLDPVEEKEDAEATAEAGQETAPQDAVQTQTYQLRVEVVVERHQIPTRYLTGSTAGERVFGTLRAVPYELEQRNIAADYWRPVGRDPYLENRILAAIVRQSFAIPRMEEQPVIPAPATTDQPEESAPRATPQTPVVEPTGTP